MSESGAIVVLLREPLPGKVKTRLAASIGAEDAAAVYSRLIDVTLTAAGLTDVPVYLRYDGRLPEPSERLSRFIYALQSPGNLGDRMRHALDDAQALHGRAILIGSDCPEISEAILRDALLKLHKADVVIGPATDGGYYLIGIAGPPDRRLFADMPWSTDRVFALTLDRCAEAGLQVAILPMLSDVDTLEDLARFPGLLPHSTG